MARIANTALREDLARALEEAMAAFAAANPRSRAEDEAAAAAMPGGNTRTVLFHPPFPLTLARGEGAFVWDIDGHRYANFVGEFGAGLFGHSEPRLAQAVSRAMASGWVLGGPNRYERLLAAELARRFPSLDKLRFTNSGTEANMMAIVTARAVTGRAKVMVFEGGYHGGVFTFAHGGSPINAPFDYVMAPFNDAEATLALIEAHAGELACAVVEPLQGAGGMIPAEAAFLRALREATQRHGIVLIFDEVITSRLSGGGLQQLLGIVPDMTTLGKYIGGGAPFGAFGGREDLMRRFDPRAADAIGHAGTFNNNPITHAAGVAAMTELYTPQLAEAFNARGDALRERLNAIALRHGLPLHVSGLGSIMQIHCCEGPLRNERDAGRADPAKAALLFHELLARGQRPTWRNSLLLCLPMTDADLDAFAEAFDDTLAARGHLLAAE